MNGSRYFRRNFDMHWTDRYSQKEWDEREARLAKEHTHSATLANIVPILRSIEERLAALEEPGVCSRATTKDAP